MKTEEEGLRETFNKNIESNLTAVPDFDLMWKSAEENSSHRKQIRWRIAASVLLIIMVGVALVLLRNSERDKSGVTITAWQEPTKSFMNTRLDFGQTDLTNWTSPTKYLLETKDENIK